MRGRFAPGTFRNKIVVVGAGAPTLKDIHPTSAAGDEVMTGPELQANAIATALDGFPLQSSPLGLDLYLIAAMGLVVPLGSLRLRPLSALAGAFALAAVYLVAVQIAFDRGAILPVVYPLLAITVGTIGTLMVHYAADAVERIRTRDAFARFVPAAVVDEVLDKAGSDVRLGGVKREATVLFSDIRGFTALSEGLDADVVVDILNRYLTEMTEAIMAEEEPSSPTWATGSWPYSARRWNSPTTRAGRSGRHGRWSACGLRPSTNGSGPAAASRFGWA